MTPPSQKTIAATTFGALLVLSSLTTQTFAQSAQTAAQAESSAVQRADEDMTDVLNKLKELGAKPIGTQSVEQTREQPTPHRM